MPTFFLLFPTFRHVFPPPGGIALALFALIALPAAVAAEIRSADEAARLALRQNPDLAAARHLVAEARGRSRDAGRPANPEVEAEVAGGPDAEGRVSVGFTQKFPLTSRLRLERKLSALDVRAAELEIQVRERRVVSAARTAFYELAATQAAVRLLEKQTKLAVEFAEKIRKSASEGLASDLEAGEAELAVESLRVRSGDPAIEAAGAEGKLAGLLGLPATGRVEAVSSLALPDQLPEARSLKARPDLELAALALESGDVETALARASRLEDVSVGIFAEGERFRDEPEGIEPEALAGLRFSIPLPLWKTGAGRVAEAESARARRAAEADALRGAVLREIATTYRVMAARHQAALRSERRLVPAARAQAEAAVTAFQRGEGAADDVFRSRLRLTEIELETLTASKNYFLAHAAWLDAIGEQPFLP